MLPQWMLHWLRVGGSTCCPVPTSQRKSGAGQDTSTLFQVFCMARSGIEPMLSALVACAQPRPCFKLPCYEIPINNIYCTYNNHTLRLIALCECSYLYFRPCFFIRWNISVICLTVVIKLAIKVFFSLYFQTFWPKWISFFSVISKTFRSMTEKKQI